MNVQARLSNEFNDDSIFDSLHAVSEFFEAGAMGYSPTRQPGNYDGLELRTLDWRVEPLQVQEVRSSFFENETLFPSGSVHFDNALLMKEINHEWHEQQKLCA